MTTIDVAALRALMEKAKSAGELGEWLPISMQLNEAAVNALPALLDAFEDREKVRQSLLLIQQPVYGPMSDELFDKLMEAKAVLREFLRGTDAS